MRREDAYVDRKFKARYVLKDLLAAVKNEKCDRVIALTGQKRIGKTTVLKMLCNEVGDAAMFTCNSSDDMDSIVSEINSMPNSVVVLDEITEVPDFYEKSNMLYDSISKKKVVITGTDSLVISKAASIRFADRVREIRIYPMSLLESKSVSGTETVADYYMVCGYFDRIDIEKEIDLVVKSVCDTYLRTSGASKDFDTVKSIVQALMFSAVWTELFTRKSMLAILGVKNSDLDIIRDKLYSSLFEAGFFKSKFDTQELTDVFLDLERAGVVKRCKDLLRPLGSKMILMNMKFKTYMYKEVLRAAKLIDVYVDERIYRGIIFENICNFSVAALTNDYVQSSLNNEGFAVEVDDILEDSENFYVIDYKFGSKINNNKAIDNRVQLKTILRKYKKNVKTAYVYTGETCKDKINIFDFLRSVKAGTLSKLIK